MTIADMESRLTVLRECLAWHTQAQNTTTPYPSPAFPSSRPSGRIPYYSLPSGSGGRASIQLQGAASSGYARPALSRKPVTSSSSFSLSASAAPFVPSSLRKKPTEVISVPLSSVLRESEEVLFRIILHKDQTGQNVYAVLTTVFDGAQLVVTQSEHTPSLVGMTSVKPGEILYRFMEALKENQLLKRSFTVAPWRLCSVTRDGVEETLEELRRKFLQSREAGSQQSEAGLRQSEAGLRQSAAGLRQSEAGLRQSEAGLRQSA